MASDNDKADWTWFEALYRQNYAEMVRLARFLTGDRSVAEEVVQEAFARLYRRDRPDNPPGYLRVAVVNECSNWRRSSGRSERRLHQLQALSGERFGQGGVSIRARELDATLMRLPYRERVVIVLRYWLGMSEAEIAEAVGCRPGTVKSRHSRALAKIRKEL